SDGDHKVGDRSVAVAVANGVAEAVGNAARGARTAGIGISPVGRDRQRAVSARNRGPGPAGTVGAGIGGDYCAVRTLRVVGDHVPADRAVLAGRDRVGIVHRGRVVVDNGDRERLRIAITVDVGDCDGDELAGAVAAGVVG